MRAVLPALINFLAFEAAWLAAVTGGAAGWPWLGSVPAALVVLLHLVLAGARWPAELALVLAVTVLGTAVEAGFMAAGLITYAGTTPDQLLPPVWIIALWFGFGTLPTASLAWLKGRVIAQILLGLIAGPLTYWGGVELGAASWGMASGSPLLWIGLAWAAALPAIFQLAALAARAGAVARN